MSIKSSLKKQLVSIYTEYIYRYQKHQLLHNPEVCIRSRYKKYMGEELNLTDPKTLNEKLNWLKLYWFDPEAFIGSDKYRVRELVENRGLGGILNELYAVWDSPDSIDISSLPNEFVMKTTHDSGHIAICTDKKNFDLSATKKMFQKAMRYDYCFFSAEWPYHTEKPRIVCERLLKDNKAGELFDYKFYCFNGEPYCIFFASDRKNHVKADYYDLEWNLMPFRWRYEPSGRVYPAPERLQDMIEYAKILSKGFPFVRVDFYQANGQVYFGELTFFHGGGYGHYQPETIDRSMGDMITLPERQDAWKTIREFYSTKGK